LALSSFRNMRHCPRVHNKQIVSMKVQRNKILIYNDCKIEIDTEYLSHNSLVRLV